MQDWLLMEEFPLNAPTLSHTDIVDALDSKCCEIIEDHATNKRQFSFQSSFTRRS